MRRFAVWGLLALCLAVPPMVLRAETAPDAAKVANPAPISSADYTLGPGDKLRITVFGEKDLSGEFDVDGGGNISMPLIGNVVVVKRTVAQIINDIEGQLRGGYLRDPKVSIDVVNYRPFFILGEVLKPGSYPYVSGMTVVNAVALAGGYTYRADKDDITIVRAADSAKKEQKAGETGAVMPGDVVRVPERFF